MLFSDHAAFSDLKHLDFNDNLLNQFLVSMIIIFTIFPTD